MSDKDEDVIATAKERYKHALDRDSHNREKAKADLRFLAATPDDPWQWEQSDLDSRKGRPTLTINKLPQHVRQVTNDIRQNRPSIKYRPADSKADVEVADILMGLVRHIESNSDADVAYDTCAENQVAHGTGYVRVLADYISEASFDQDIFIRQIDDTFKCTDDPDAVDPAGADRKYFFIEEEISEKEYAEKYPKADPIDWQSSTIGDWVTSDKKIRIAEYFEVCTREKTLLLWASGETSFEGEKLPVGVYQGEASINKRQAMQPYVMWRKINGQQVLEEKEFPCKYIPIARAWGNHYVIDGKVYVHGLVRPSKDSQRMYNVAQSAIVERVMQAPKAPFIAAVDAVEGYEKEWANANKGNDSFLPWNHVDDQNNPIPMPQRTPPASIEPGLIQIAQSSADDIKSETGQYDASLGARSNETSGRAIMARQREGDVATFHYVDNLARCVRHLGRIVLDMIPRIYDTKRIARILGEDGSPANATLDPSLPVAMEKTKGDDGKIQRIFNPNVGTYDVYTTTGPSFTSRREEAVQAMSEMTQANPQLWQVIGDQLVKNMDWPGAEDMAKRLKTVLLPQVQAMANEDDDQPEIPPQVQMAMQQMSEQLQQMQQAGQEMQGELQQSNQKLEKETSARLKAELSAQEAQTMLRLTTAKQQALDEIDRERQETDQGPASAGSSTSGGAKGQAHQSAPVVVIDSTGQSAVALAPLVNQLAEQVAAQAQEASESLQAVSAQTQALSEAVAELAAPKATSMRAEKQPDGSFIVQKMEGGQLTTSRMVRQEDGSFVVETV
jgi:hypothetical protein